jgi:hypothetical protein
MRRAHARRRRRAAQRLVTGVLVAGAGPRAPRFDLPKSVRCIEAGAAFASKRAYCVPLSSTRRSSANTSSLERR